MSIKKLKDYNGEYGVSDDGKVFTYKQGRNREVKQHNHKGYQRVFLFNNNTRKAHFVHRLVTENFIKNPNNKEQVNHKDGNKRNNKVNNLEWMTREENQKHSRDVLGNTGRGFKNANYGNRISKLYPSPELSNRLIELGIPRSKHNLAELGEMLPNDKIRIFKMNDMFFVENYEIDNLEFSNAGERFVSKTEADARAKMLVYLKENNLI